MIPTHTHILRTRIRAAVVFVAVILMATSVMWISGSARADEAPLPDISPVISSAGFSHPGIFDSVESLRTSRAHVEAGDEPWATVYRQLYSSVYATRGAPDFSQFAPAGAADAMSQRCSLDSPSGCITYCGSNNVPDVGCSDARADARAVYAQALLYWYSGNASYAQRAIAILNAYAKHFKGNTGSNGPLMTAWIGETMLRGAEILRYAYKGDAHDPAFDVKAFSAMLRVAAVPTLSTVDYGVFNGNWKLSAADSLINTAVFLDDRTLYTKAIGMWREEVPAYIYLSSDGRLPTPPVNSSGTYQTPETLSCLWLADKVHPCQTTPKTQPRVTFQNGQAQESCRDFGHTALGLGAIVNAAETAWIQGDNLYGQERTRIMTGILYAVQISQTYAKSGWPDGFCGGTTNLENNLSLANLAAETAYNAYAIRQGIPFTTIRIPGYKTKYPNNDPLASFISKNRDGYNPVSDVSAWEGLTHRLASVPFAVAHESARPATATPTPTGETSRTSAGEPSALEVIVPAAAIAIVLAAAGILTVATRRRRR